MRVGDFPVGLAGLERITPVGCGFQAGFPATVLSVGMSSGGGEYRVHIGTDPYIPHPLMIDIFS